MKYKLLDFYSEHCGPCRMMDPIVAQVLSQVEEFELEKVNIMEDPKRAGSFGITSVPTFILLNEDGFEVARTVGARGPKQSNPEFEAYLKKAAKFGCSRLITGVLLTLLLFVIMTQYIPSPYNTYIILGIVLWKTVEISLNLADGLLGPPPQPPI
jgi:thioredoxin 1